MTLAVNLHQPLNGNDMKRILIASIIVLSTLAGKSQDFKADYGKAKQLFDQREFAKALEAFKPLMVYDQANPFAEYSAFYYAVCAFRENYKTLSKNTLLSIEQNYSAWNQIDEVRYWLALIYFEQGEYFQAMQKLTQIRQEKGQRALKESYISKIKDAEILRMLLEDFHDPLVAEFLVRLLLAQGREDTVMEARRLIGTFGFNEEKFQIRRVEVKPSPRRIAILFPFLAQTLEPTPATKRNQYALDLYHGMKLAADSLNNAGLPVELALYDTERNREKVAEILSKPELKNADFLVGPLFNDEIKPVKDFSSLSKIPMIHPVSNSPEFLSGNDFAILFQPSWATLGRESANYLASLNLTKPCMVFYEKTTKDSTIAHAFKTRADQLKIPVVLFKEVTKEKSESIGTLLTSAVKFDKWQNPVEFKLKRDSLGSIFVASDSELIFTKVIAAVDARDDETIIIGQESWLEKPGMDWIKFESLKITLSSPNFYSPFSPAFKKFEDKFIQIHRIPPGLYARIGYEFMLFIGQSLPSTYIQDNFNFLKKEIDFPGSFSQGFKSRGQSDNQLVPFVRFSNGELVRVN